MKTSLRHSLSILSWKAFLLCATAFLFSLSVYSQTYQKISLSGFNADLVANGSVSPVASTTTSMDVQGNVMYANGYSFCSSISYYGLPATGAFSSATTGYPYQMANYTGNNALYLPNYGSSGTLAFSTAGSYSSIAILSTSSEGGSSVGVTLNFSDGSSFNTGLNLADWYNGNPYAIAGIGRVRYSSSCGTDQDGSNPRLYDNVITLSAPYNQKLLTSITFSNTSGGGRPSIFAVTGIAQVGTPSAPIGLFTSNLSTTGFTANWTAVSGATSYVLDVSTSSSFANYYSTYNNLTVGNVTASNVSATAGIYYYRVRAVNAAGQSLSSATTTVTVPAPVAATALNFDGVDDYVAINSPYRAFNKEITVEFWMNAPSANMPFGSVMGQGTSNVDAMTNDVWLMHPNTNGTITFYVNDAGTWRSAQCNITAGSWHHYAGVANATSTSIYVDGVLIISGPGISNSILSNAGAVFHIGKDVRHDVGRFGNFSVDEVRVWSRALCQAEIVNNMNCEPNPASQTGLEEYYRFNQGAVNTNNAGITTLNDLSGKSRNGTLTNFGLTGTASNWVASGSTNNGTCAAFVAPIAPITGTTSVCLGASSTLANTNTGGVWTSSNTAVATINATTGAVSTLSAGTTTITYTNTCGGISTTTFTVNAYPTATITPSGPLSFCLGGSVTLTANAGGTSYLWSNGETTQAITILATNMALAGSYTVKVTNASGCATTSAPANITLFSLPTATITAGGSTTFCTGGSVTLTASAGNSYLWSNGAITQAITTSVAGSYSVTVTNASGCSASSAATVVTVNALPTPTISAGGSTTFCTGGSVTLTASAGSSYLWSNGATTQAITTSVAGSYTVTVTNASGCSAKSAATDVIVNPLPTATTSKTNVVCPGGNTGSITVTPTIGTAPYQYSNDGGATYVSSNIFSSLAVGNYSIYIKDANGCSNAVGTVSITQADNVLPTITAPSNVTVTLINGNCTATGIALGTPVTADNCSVASVTNDAPATYPLGNTTVTWTVTDNSNNSATATQTVTVVSPEINITGNNVTIVNGDVTPSTADNTDLGGTLPGVPVSKIFTIQNTGTSALTVSSVNSSNGAFAVSGISLPYVVPANGSVNFTTTFTASSVGTQTATLTVNNNDCDEASYNFDVKAAIICTMPGFINTDLYIQESTDNNSCTAVVSYDLAATGTPAPGLTYVLTGATTGTGAGTGSGVTYNIGITHVVVTAVNPCGTLTTSFDVTVVDDVPPVVVSKNITIYLDQSGKATFNVNDLNGGSHDNCGAVTLSMDHGTICGIATEGNNVFLQAPAGRTIDNIQFASYGTPTGSCGNFQLGWCNSGYSYGVVSAMAIGQNSVNIPASNGIFGDPCYGTPKRLMIQASYGGDGTIATFNCNNLGDNTVTYIVTDAAGNTSTGTAIVTVVDRQGPIISAPDVNVNATDPTQCGVIANFAVTATDCTPGTNTISYSKNPGTFFNVGSTPVTVTATDVLGNVSTAQFNVIVRDASGPVITVPAAISKNNDANQCGALVSFAATATDCSGVNNISYSVQPGTLFPIGLTNVVITATDIFGNQSTASFPVTITDNEPPVITDVPANISVSNDADNCGAVVNYTKPVVIDNCGGQIQTKAFNYTGAQEAFTVPAGVTSLIIDMSGAAGGNAANGDYYDGYGGLGGRVKATITVTPGQVLYLNVGGMGKTAVDGYSSPGGYNGGGNGKSYSNYYYNGGGGGGASDIRIGAASLYDRIIVAGGGGGAGYGPAGGNGGDLTGAAGGGWYGNGGGGGSQSNGGYSDFHSGDFGLGGDGNDYGESGGGGGGWYGGGGGGDWSSGGGGSSYTIESAINVMHLQGAQNGDGVITLSWSLPTTLVQTTGLPSGATFPVGKTTNTFTAKDAAGNVSTVSFDVIVTDTQKPNLTLPANITVNNDVNKCGAAVTITPATATDNCAVESVIGVRSDALALTADYPIGSTTITWTAVDIHGNPTTGKQTITVVDNQVPVITCPIDINVFATSAAGAIVNYTAPIGTDNCSGAVTVRTAGNASGSTFQIGTTTITHLVRDAAGLTASCSFNVTVTGLKPVIVVPHNISVSNDAGKCGAIVDFAATDNTGIPASVITYSIQPNSFFPIGSTDVVATATNAVGTSVATFTVTVTDDELPVVITKPITIQLDATGHASIAVADVDNGSTDNCGIATYSLDKTTFDCSSVGANTVTLTVTDIHNNVSTGTAVVTVEDKIAPTVITQPVTVQLDATGHATVTTIQVDNGSTDNCSIATYSLDKTTFDCSNLGANTVILTVTDANGNISSANAIVTVQDNIAPVLSAAPGNVTVECDAVPAAAVVTVSDNCTATVAMVEVRTDGNCPNNYTLTRTWTATDISGNHSSVSQVITVQDTKAPVLSAAPVSVTVECDAVPAPAVLTATDNCSTPSVNYAEVRTNGINNNNYILTRTWTATDACGNASNKVQVITVKDTKAPLVTVPANISVDNDLNVCGATVNFAATATDNCSPVTISYSQNPGTVFAIGTTNVTITAKDITGNTTVTNFTVKVTDTQKPTVTDVAPQVFCANPNGNMMYTIPVSSATDNCGVASVTYAVSGVTNRTGSGYNASGTFNIGTSSIKWTVTDVNGNISTSTTTVTINPLPTASYVSTTADDFCNKVTLTASSSIAPASYSWTSGSTPVVFVNNAQFVLGQTSGDGVYNVFVKVNATGCVSETAVAYTFQKQNLASSYTIIAYKEVELGKNNVVNSGSIGVLSSKGEAEFEDYSRVNSVGSFVKAARIEADKTALIGQKILAAANPVLPTMLYNTANTKSLPNYEVKAGTTVTLTANYGNLNIKKGSVVTLSGSTYGTIHTEEGVQLSFTQTTINIDQLQIDKGPSAGGYSYIRFAPNTKVLVSKGVKIGDQVFVNPESNRVTFYVGTSVDPKKSDDDWDDDAKFSVNGKDIKVVANVVMPTGKLKVDGGDDDNDSRKAVTYINMTGLFIATEVESEGKNVIWNSFDCGAAGIPLVNNTNATQATTAEATAKAVTTEEELKVVVMPNPSTTYFTLKLESKYETPVNLRVMDGSGRVVDAKSQIGSNSTIQIGHNYSSGTYYAELIQGTQRKVVQLIKGRG